MNWKNLRNNIPSHIQAGRNGLYEVVWVESFKDNDTLGETRFDPKQIAIKLGQTNKETVATLFHEFIHSVSYEFDIILTEKQVIGLEKSIYYTFKLFEELKNGKKVQKRKSRNRKKVR